MVPRRNSDVLVSAVYHSDMKTHQRIRRLFTASLSAAVLLLLAGCVPNAITYQQGDRDDLHSAVSVAVAEALPESSNVETTTMGSGFGLSLSVRIVFDNPSVVSAEVLERALAAAWSVDRGQSNTLELNIRDGNGDGVDIDDFDDQLGVGSAYVSRVTASRSDLSEYFGR